MLRELVRPFAYLRIQHASGTLRAVNWALPVGAAAVCVALGAWVSPSVNVFHADGLLVKLLGFVQSLPGFYLAALAAVATFAKEGLDRLMPGEAPKVDIIYNGQLTVVELTRRRFLSMMFAYLTVLSILLTMAAILATTFVDPIRALLTPLGRAWLKGAFAFFYLAMLAQMLVITMWGIYYLGERMHTPDY